MALTPGTRLGPYEVTAQIGVGGMGEVYKATDTNLKRAVAIKVLPASVATDAERLARFQREAEVLAALNHPNIAAIYGLERSGATTALVMELVEGPTLADRIAPGAISVDEALLIAKQIAEALEAAHEQGIIHRDLKPANIKVREDGTVKVLDFGLAKAMEPVGSAPNVSQSPTITSPAMMTGVGIILGTAAYMSPEQARGKAVDKRTDIWAFGCVLYEMLTARAAFRGETISDVIAATLEREPDWTALPAAVPPSIRRLLRRCLEKDPKRRIHDIADAQLELEPIDASEQDASPLWRRAFPALAFAIVASALAGAAVWQFRPSPPQTVTRFTYRLGDGQQFTNTGRHSVAISPDGTQMAYVANYRLYLKALWEVEATPIAGTEGDQVTTPVFSPDGRSIAFFSGPGANEGTLRKITTSGGAPVTLCQASNPYGMSWEGDSILFGQAGKRILRVSANGGTPEVLARVKDNEVAQSPQMLSGGRPFCTPSRVGPTGTTLRSSFRHRGRQSGRR